MSEDLSELFNNGRKMGRLSLQLSTLTVNLSKGHSWHSSPELPAVSHCSHRYQRSYYCSFWVRWSKRDQNSLFLKAQLWDMRFLISRHQKRLYNFHFGQVGHYFKSNKKRIVCFCKIGHVMHCSWNTPERTWLMLTWNFKMPNRNYIIPGQNGGKILAKMVRHLHTVLR